MLSALQQHKILGGVDLGRFYPELRTCVLMNATEMTTTGDIEAVARALTEVVACPGRRLKQSR